MKVVKEKRKVRIVCHDNIVLTGFIHLDEGLRTQDLLNFPGKRFIPVTVVDVYYMGSLNLSAEAQKLIEQRDVVILSIDSIKWVEEID